MKYRLYRGLRLLGALTLLAALASSQLIMAQSQTTVAPTPIVFHKNKYSPADDVKIGRDAAAQAERQLQIIRDPQISEYLESLGQRLVRSIPQEFQHPEFRYYFKVVNDRSINAFALPGGPMYVNTGAIMAARNEGELAGVMAHELSHVALRHGTAQATKAQKWQIGAIGAAIAGTILAGPAAGELAGGGIGVYFQKYSREYETEADLLGARIMANAGYDPHDLANMFKTIEAQGGGGGGFLSDHPSPKDRYAKINAEAERLQVAANPIKLTPGFQAAQREINGNVASNRGYRNRNQGNYPSNGNNYPSNYPANGNNYPSAPSDRVELPSSRFRTYDKGTFTVDIPENWNEVNQNGLWYAPRGAYGSANGQTVFTHAVTFGSAQTQNRNLQQATTEFVNSLTQGNNNNMRARGSYQRMDVDGRFGELISFDNVNEATGKPELINVVTTQLRDGQLFYMISVTPRDEYTNYQNTLLAIQRSLRLND
ncbi:MAG TPA: M48 family metallopeptidase [Pyrinomonadaceae bacterium]|jgi:Zn-dependent protease with chaperone function|nr:M48 family metallopeptidase [Pyrinomonadaceae bacterium]